MPAGTYTFTLADTLHQSLTRVFVFDAKHQLVANAAVVRVKRNTPGATILFRRRPLASAAAAPEISEWYSAGGTDGYRLLPRTAKRVAETTAGATERAAK